MTAVAEYPRLDRKVPTWHEQAACRLFPELDWHDAKPGTATEQACRLICSACPVRFACAVGALERGEPWGIWGGLDRRDRREIAAEYGYPVPAMLPEHGQRARYIKHGCRCTDCTAAHALYEYDRRRSVERRRFPMLVLILPSGHGRRTAFPGQLVLPLGITRDDTMAAA